MRIALILPLGLGLLLCCGSPPEPETPRINPKSVPSLALLDEGTERRTEVSGSGTGRSCEEVIDEQRSHAAGGTFSEEPDAEHNDEVKAILNDGAYLGGCNVPESSGVELCVAVIGGRAEGVTVVLTAGVEREADCVADAIRRLEFPEHELLTVARTQFDAS